MRFEKDYLTYSNKLSDEDKAWIKQFYNEYYCAPSLNENSIIKDPAHKTDANRIHNSSYSDIFSIAERTGSLVELSGDEERFMTDASDEWDWKNTYKIQGYEAAVQDIFYQAERDLQNKTIDVKLTLARFLNKFLELKKINGRKKKNKADNNE